jgi:hypothetical protein
VATGYPTTIFPHMPLHVPPLTVECKVHRNRYVPADLNVNDVV